jgi:hypothetical protein
LWFFLKYRPIPDTVPPVPAPATTASTFPPLSRQISGPVEISCASMFSGL